MNIRWQCQQVQFLFNYRLLLQQQLGASVQTNKQCHIKNIAAREDLAVKDKNQTYKKITANGRDMGKRNDPHTHRLIL